MPRLHNDHATLECRRTPWDERVFGAPCAEITHFQAEHEAAGQDIFRQFETWAQAQGVQFAYGRFEPTRLVKQVVHQAGFYFAEASYCIRHHKLQGTEAFDRLIRPGPVLEPTTEADHEELRTILATDFEHGRIHEDPWVAPAAASLRYRNWLTDLLAQQHEVYTYRLKGEVIGLHIQRGDGEKVDFLLTGVKRSHALLGVSLWAQALRLNRLRGVRETHTLISAANVPIVNLYRRFEFQFEALLLGFHKRWPQLIDTSIIK
jgi:hypothetical protein